MTTHDGRTDCSCRRCANARHHRLVREIKLAISRRYKSAAYVDDITQYHGRTVRRIAGHDTIGPWVDAGMTSGAFDLIVVYRGRAIFLDAKTGAGRLTAEQLRFQSWIRAAGGIAESVRSPEQAIETIEAAEYPRRDTP